MHRQDACATRPIFDPGGQPFLVQRIGAIYRAHFYLRFFQLAVLEAAGASTLHCFSNLRERVAPWSLPPPPNPHSSPSSIRRRPE